MTDILLLVLVAVLIAVLFNLRDRRVARERAERNREVAERDRVEQAWMADARAARRCAEASPPAGRRVQKTSESVYQTARGQKELQSHTDAPRRHNSQPVDPMMEMFNPMSPVSPYYAASPSSVAADPAPDRSTCDAPAPDTSSSSSYDSSSNCDTSSSSSGSDW